MRTKLFLFFFILINLSLFTQENLSDGATDRVDETTLSMSTDSGANQSAVNVDNAIGIRDYLLVVFVLLFVIGALYFVLKIVKRVGGHRVGIDNDLIHVISTRALKGTTALHLVEVGRQIFLVGATDHSINSIAEITEKETKDMIALNLSADNVPQTSFFQFFTDKLKGGSVNSSQEEATPTIKTQKEKLDRY